MNSILFRTALLLCIFCVGKIYAQSDEQAYSEEFTYGINFNSNAGLIGGFNFKWAFAKGPKQYQSVGFEIVNVKHPKEYRFPNPASGNTFLAYKTNYLFVFRPFYAREFTLFRKAAEEGVHVNAILGGGPSIGMLKPYHILYLESLSNPQAAYSIQYTKDLNMNQIYGIGSLTDGIENSKYSLGVHAKASVTFEFGQIKNSVIGLEAGVLVEKFTSEQKILEFAQNRSFFTSTFFTLYYGKKY
ncbi:MAG TPA: hypothetical protein PKY12_04020 [Catalimonadaceae bacterium]|jgi:hypothetical protein|nr:hypothetical protein [Catalimonadaceae bacterium]